MKHTAGLTLVMTTALAPTAVFGLGLRVPDQDPKAIARGNAFTATADNPSAVYYNPAGITQSTGHNASVGVNIVTLGSEREAGGQTTSTRDSVHVLPQVYYTYGFTNVPIALGMGLYSPYGHGMEWPNNTTFRQTTIEGSMTYLTLNPVVAWKPLETLSIAAGPTLNYGDTELRNGKLPFSWVNGADSIRFRGDDTAAGFNAGVLWHPLEQHSFGLTYRSATSMNFSGNVRAYVPLPPPNYANFSTAATAKIDFPQQVVLGYSYRPTPKWNLEFDVDWTDWDSLNTVTLKPAIGAPTAIPFNYRSSFMYEWGVTRYFDNGYSLSGGYMFSENSVPEKWFSPGIPDSDRHVFSVGIGKQYKRIRWDAAYQFAYGPSRDISGSINPGVSGSYTFLSNALALSVGLNF